MYAVNVTTPAQLPLVSGCQNSGAGTLKKKKSPNPPIFFKDIYVFYFKKEKKKKIYIYIDIYGSKVPG